MRLHLRLHGMCDLLLRRLLRGLDGLLRLCLQSLQFSLSCRRKFSELCTQPQKLFSLTGLRRRGCLLHFPELLLGRFQLLLGCGQLRLRCLRLLPPFFHFFLCSLQLALDGSHLGIADFKPLLNSSERIRKGLLLLDGGPELLLSEPLLLCHGHHLTQVLLARRLFSRHSLLQRSYRLIRAGHRVYFFCD